jgi:hypothetical protein
MIRPQDDPATCPRCESTSIQAVPVKKSSLGAAFAAEYFLGTAAGVAASSETVIQAVCLKCGCQWFPGTPQEEQIRALSGQRGDVAKLSAQTALVQAEARKDDATALKVIVVIIVIVVFAELLLQN